MFCFFGWEARGTLAPQPEIAPAPPALEGEIPTTGAPGRSLNLLLKPMKSSYTKWQSTEGNFVYPPHQHLRGKESPAVFRRLSSPDKGMDWMWGVAEI